MKRLVLVFLLAVLPGLFSGCGPSEHASEPAGEMPVVQATPITTATCSVAEVYETVGTVEARSSSVLQSKLTGYVLSMNVREGDRVDAGQVLLEIDAREAAAQSAQAESALNEAMRAREETGNALQAAVHAKEAAEAASTLASATLKRYEGLMESRAVTPQAFDEVAAKQKAAAADAARASEMVRASEARLEEVAARVEQAKAGLDLARTVLGYAQVTAPFAGVITRKSVDTGDLASPGTPLLVLENTEQYQLVAQVNEERVHAMKTGMATTVLLDALAEGEVSEAAPLQGTVAEIVPAADPASRSFEVKVDLPRNPALKSGMFGRARFDVGAREVLVIPATALFRRGQLDGVYVLDEKDVARLRLVVPGKKHETGVEILSGLEAGERIVSNNTGQVVDGAVVKQN